MFDSISESATPGCGCIHCGGVRAFDDAYNASECARFQGPRHWSDSVERTRDAIACVVNFNTLEVNASDLHEALNARNETECEELTHVLLLILREEVECSDCGGRGYLDHDCSCEGGCTTGRNLNAVPRVRIESVTLCPACQQPADDDCDDACWYCSARLNASLERKLSASLTAAVMVAS